MKNLICLFFVLFANCSCMTIPKQPEPIALQPFNEDFAYPGAIMLLAGTKEGSPGIVVPLLTEYSLTCVNGCLKVVCTGESANLLCVRECLSYYPCQLTVIESGDWTNSDLRLTDMNKNKLP